MGRWSRRLLFLLIGLVWLFLMSLPLMAFILAARNQIQVGAAGGSHLRIFLISEQTEEGIGLEWSRVAPGAAGCRQTSVNFLMWRGEGHRVTYCQCPEIAGESGVISEGICPAPPD
jgi:hypothetical protein